MNTTSEGSRSYRKEDQMRMSDLLSLIPTGDSALDIGAREGHISKLLVERFNKVTALDLEVPDISHERIQCVKGDVTHLEYPDDSFDVIVCAEVLEHIPPKLLQNACAEISRVAKKTVVIGVPFRQDTRIGRTSCLKCGEISPPYGHVNTFDESKLLGLFSNLKLNRFLFTGSHRNRTNFLSTWLADVSGNYYGVYHSGGNCVHCGAPVVRPTDRSLPSKVAYKLSHWIMKAQRVFVREQPIWIHAVFDKP